MTTEIHTKVQLGSLTDEGIAAIRSWLRDDVPLFERTARLVEPMPPVLDNPAMFQPIQGFWMANRKFDDSLDFAKEVVAAAKTAGIDINSLREDAGFWGAIVAIFIDQFFPADPDGSRKRLDVLRYLLGGGRTGFLGKASVGKPHRHLAWHAVIMHCDYGKQADKFLLGKPLNQYTDLIEPILGRSEVRRNVNLMPIIDFLYWDREANTWAKGTKASKKKGKNKGGVRKGGLRDAVEVLAQFNRNFDIEIMPVDAVVKLLPPDIFGRAIKRANKRLKQNLAELIKEAAA